MAVIKRYKKEILKLTAKGTLLSIFGLALPFFEASRIYRADIRKLKNELESEHSNIAEKLYYLKKNGYILNFVEGKEKYIEITPRGVERIRLMQERDHSIERPEIWDKKWWLVIFDVPDPKKSARDNLRRKLLKYNFEKIQESVYVFPFNCTEEISAMTYQLGIQTYVLIMISEIIQGEEIIIKKFIDKNILNKSDLKN